MVQHRCTVPGYLYVTTAILQRTQAYHKRPFGYSGYVTGQSKWLYSGVGAMAGLGLSGQKSTARRDHAHRDRRGLFSIHTKYGLLNRLPTKVSFSIFD